MADIVITEMRDMKMYELKYVKDNGEESESVRISYRVIEDLIGEFLTRYLNRVQTSPLSKITKTDFGSQRGKKLLE